MFETGRLPFLAVAVVLACVVTVTPLGPSLDPLEFCGVLGSVFPDYALVIDTGYYSESSSMSYPETCPAHMVNNIGYQRRRGIDMFCFNVVTPPAPIPSANCTSNSTSLNATANAANAANATVSCNSTEMTNATYSNFWATLTGCIHATCLPRCKNGATCYCGMTCRCKCPLGFTGMDCSVNTTSMPANLLASAKLLYSFSDPHVTMLPDKTSTRPWVVDLSGNGYHGEINGHVVLDGAAGPYGPKAYTSFIFGLNPNNRGYISINDLSYDMSLTKNSSKYTILAYYKPGDQGNNETLLFHFGKTGTTQGAIISSTLDEPSFYYHDPITGYRAVTGSAYTTRMSNTSYNMLHFEIDTVTKTFSYGTGTNALQSVNIGNMTATQQGFFIGNNTNNPNNTYQPVQIYLKGNLAALLISNQTGFSGVDVAGFETFAATNFGTGTPSLVTLESDTPCPVPPIPTQAMPTALIVNATIGDSLDYFCPPFFTHAVLVIIKNQLTVIPGVRVDTSVCGATGWNSTMGCISDPAPVFCDPICINGGTCICTPHSCHCQCWPEFTGPDCFAPTSAVPTNFHAFWPITQETLGGDKDGNMFAVDFANNNKPLIIENMGFDAGPWNAINTAARQHYLRARSHMKVQSPFILSGTSDFTILLYMKLAHKPLSLPGRTTIPLFLYSSSKGAVANEYTAFYLDETTGHLIYYPGDTQISHAGLPFTANDGTWVPIKIAYSSASGMIGTASWDATPAPATAIVLTASPNSTLYMGYDDVTDVVGDMSVTCVGVYNVLYSDQLAWGHGRVCQMFSKQKCVSPPYPVTPAVQSSSSLWSAGKITYTCFNGMVWNISGNMTQSFGCNPSQSMIPVLDWDMPAVPGVCMQDLTVCHPACQNGATCVPGSPAKCTCPSTYIGLDCSIPRNIFPSSCNLVSLWPLTSIHMTSDGLATDLWGPNPLTVNTTSVYFPENIGPYARGGIGVAQFTESMPGTLRASPPTSPFPSGSSFVVSAFVRFDVTAGINSSDLYPLLTFTNRGVSNSPAIYLSPMGNGQFNYKSGKYPYSVSFDAGPEMKIGISASWAFVTIQYNSITQMMAMSINGSVFGASVLVVPTPMFSTRTMYVGSVDSGLVWPGEIACMSIYNWVLTNAQLVQLMAACQQVLGGAVTAAVSSNCNACSGINMPAGGLTVPDRNDVVLPTGSNINYRAPPFTKFVGTTASRTFTTTCASNGQWNPLFVSNITTNGTITCDPPCLNNGLCNCNTTTCSCVCLAGTTGKDCVIKTTNLPVGASGFWPLTGDTTDFDSPLNKPVALDFSGNNNNLVIGATVALDMGPSGYGYTALRFRNGQLNSFLSTLAPLAGLHGTSTPFTIIFYMKYNPSSDNQPVVAFSYSSQQNSEFWIDQSTGKIRYYPDNTLLEISGPDFATNIGPWMSGTFAYLGAGSPQQIGTATFDNNATSAVTNVTNVLNDVGLFVGYSNSLSSVTADISISCLGIYPAAYSSALANAHGKACQIFTKQTCNGPPSAPSYAVLSATSTICESTVSYYCWSGYYFFGTTQNRFVLSCTRSNSVFQANLFWSPSVPNCQASTGSTCYPECVNGGTCQSGTPTAICACPSGYSGVDCSINLATLPRLCTLMNLWPLSSQHIDNTGKAFDAGSLHQNLSLSGALKWPDNIGPYAALNYGVASFGASSVGAAQATMATFQPFLSRSSFTISGYLRFDPSATYTTFYPMVTFANLWTAPSPAIFISPTGQMRMLYKYASTSYMANFTTISSIGLQPWVFISVRYDASANTVDVTVNGNQSGSSVTVSPKPMFSTNKIYIGTSDTTPSGSVGVLAGQLACVSIYSVALTSAELLQLKLACDAILGGPVAPASATPACYTCSSPPSGSLAMASIADLDYNPNTVATYTAPAYSRYPTGSNNDFRTTSSTCQANLTWSPATIPAVDSPITPTLFCDPECRNGGQCQCNASGCLCACQAGFTGIDCVTPISLLTTGVKAIWPMTSDSTGRDVLGNLFAYDNSGNSANLKIGQGVVLEDGPFTGTVKNAFRLRSQVPASSLQSYSASVQIVNSSYSIILYVKYNSKNNGHQPILSWPSPGTQIWISSSDGNLLYYPGGVPVTMNGTDFITVPDTWLPVVLSYSVTLGKIGSATSDVVPTHGTAISQPNITTNFFIGYSDQTIPNINSDLSIACIGIYDGVYNASRAQNHGKLCQRYAKPLCTSGPALSLTKGFASTVSTSGVHIGDSITYTCFGGYAWDSTGTQSQATTCAQSTATSKLLPTLVWSPPSMTGSCQASTSTCIPTCLNGGTCVPGSPTAKCSCAIGFTGLACSINLAYLPTRCDLVSLWPLTNGEIDNAGQAVDIMRASTGATLPAGAVAFPANGPYSPATTLGILDVASSAVGSVQISTPYPWSPLSSFTISAYIRFSSSANYNTFYPLAGYTTTSGLTDSPGIFIAPNGAVRMFFVSAGTALHLNFTAPALIGLGPWAFISVKYERKNSTASVFTFVSPNAPAYGADISISSSPVFMSSTPFYIGSTDLTPMSDTATVFAGQIACLSIYKAALTATDTAAVLAACQNILGGPASSPALQCNLCSSMPHIPLVMPAKNDATFAAGQTVSFTCPAFTRQIDPDANRASLLSCPGNETWSPPLPPSCDNTESPRMCDPDCQNGGKCVCVNATCSCSCAAGYTGIDCLLPIGFIPSSAIAFWPLTIDTTIKDPNTNLTPMAADLSGNERHLSVGSGAGLDVGPFGPQSAFRFRSSLSGSFLTLPSLTLSNSRPFTMLFYVKYNLDAFGNQPLVSFSNGGSTFLIDQISSQVRYYPSNILLPHNGPSLTSAPATWMFAAISFLPPNRFAISVDGNPVVSTSIANNVAISGKFTIGYSDRPALIVSDLSISCFGIYDNTAFSANLSYVHAQACQRFAKQSCTGAPVVPNAFLSSSSAVAGTSVTYMCSGAGNYFNSTNSTIGVSALCVQPTNSITPTLSWSPPSIDENCTRSQVDCHPPCKNQGICSAGVCNCTSGYVGTDCSTAIEVLTCQSHLQSLWPLTTYQMTETGQAVDIWSSETTEALATDTIYANDDGPYSPSGFGLLRLTSSSVGALRVTSPSWPSMSTNCTFLISAYVHFDLAASYSTLYPFVTFSNTNGISGSPALFISKSGKARMYYESGGSQHSVDFSVPEPNVIGTATPRSFVSIQYDWDVGNITIATLEYNTMQLVYGEPVSVWPEPSFVTNADMLIGSTDMVGLSGCGTVFPGEIACLSIYNHTLPDFQTHQVLDACWDLLGGPRAGVATQLCTNVPYCSPPFNLTNATIEATGMAPPIPGQSIIEGYFTNQSWVFYVCDFDHSFVNYTVIEMNVTCDWGQWKLPYTHCRESPLQRNVLSLEIFIGLTNPTLEKYFDRINDIIVQTSLRIGNVSDSGNLTEASISAMEVIGATFERYAAIAEAGNLTEVQVLKVAHSCATAMSNLLFAVRNDTQLKSGVSDEIEAAANCSDKLNSFLAVDSSDAETTAPPQTSNSIQLTPPQLDHQYQLFKKMITTLSRLVQNALVAGNEFAVDERYFCARIKKVYFNQLPGFFVNMTLASVTFPNSADLIVGGKSINAFRIVSVVTTAVIENVFDPIRAFNIPTVSVHVYTAELDELKLNPTTPYYVVSRPLRPKWMQYSSEKVDVQCDVSKITCDVTTNADLLASFAQFPLLTNAGHFVLIFPPIDMDYDAYIAVNSAATPKTYTWRVIVKLNGALTFVSGDSSKKTPPHSYDAGAGLRIVVPENVIKYFASLQNASQYLVNGNDNETMAANASRYYLNVLMKKDTSHYGSTDDLPQSLCVMQHCYGYHLRVNEAQTNHTAPLKTNATTISVRKRRAVDLTNSTIVADEASSEDGDLTLQPDSTEAEIKFKSSYFGDLGADLVITPNTIEFSDIFSRFTTLLADNWAVLAFMVGSIVVFLAGIVIAYYYDKKDLQNWGFLPILSNEACQKVKYFVSIHYHTVKEWKLRPRVSIRFNGELCDMPFRLLKDGIRKNFTGAHPANFLVTTHHSIGRVDEVEILLATKYKPKDMRMLYSMYVDKVIVIDANSGRKYMFPVKKRLVSGKSCKATLACEDDVKNFRYLVSGHARSGITEGHPWLSIAKRPLPSNWTRVERLACVVSALFMAMLVNAMFYGKDATSPRVGIQIGGFMRLSWFTIWTSIIGSVVIIPPTSIMAFIFKKIKRRSAETNTTKTIFNIGQDVRELPPEDDEEEILAKAEAEQMEEDTTSHHYDKQPLTKKIKKPFRLPYACIVIAWLIVVACIGVSAFFIFMYSLTWGREKSLQWLTSMLLHIVQDVLIIQTIKVLVVSLISSTMLQMPDDGLEIGKLTFHPNNKKRQTLLFAKSRNVLAGIAHHILYVIVFALVINTTQNGFAYQQVKDIQKVVTVDKVNPVDGTVSDYSGIYNWLYGKLVQNFLSANLLSQGGRFTIANIYSVPNHDVVIVGPIRLRQQRVSFARCLLETSPSFTNKSSQALGTSAIRCQSDYASALGVGTSSERRIFNNSWELPVAPGDYSTLGNVSSLQESPWAYRSSDGPPYSGWQALYQSGGYYIDLPLSLKKSRASIAELYKSRWLDNSTTVLFVEFTLFNAQTNVFLPMKVVFEALNAGGMAYHIRAFPLQLYQYVGATAMLVLAIQALWILMTLTELVKILFMIKKRGFKEFAKDGWNLFDVAHVLLGLSLVGLFAVRIYVVMNTVSDMKTYRTKFVNLDMLTNWEDVMSCLYGITFFMALLLFFRNLTFNKYWAIFLGTLAKAKCDICSFVVVFVFVTFVFGSLGYVAMGSSFSEYQSLKAALITLIQNIIGISGNFMQIATRTGFAKLFSMAFSFIVLFLAVQFFMSIVNITYSVVSANAEHETNWDVDLSEYLAAGISDLFRRKKNEDDENSAEPTGNLSVSDEEFQPVGDLANLEHIVHRLEHIVEKQKMLSETVGKNDRNMISWLALQIRQNSKHNLPTLPINLPFSYPPTNYDVGHKNVSANCPPPSPSAYRVPRQTVQSGTANLSVIGAGQRKNSGALRAGFVDYLNNNNCDSNVVNQSVMQSEAFRQLQALPTAVVIAEVDGKNVDDAVLDRSVFSTSAAIRRVYENEYVRKPSLNPVEMSMQ